MLQLSSLAMAIVVALTVQTADAAQSGLQKPYSQGNEDQFNLLRYLGGTGPYVSHKGYGISDETPDSCEISQVHVVMRHGERYPTTGTGAGFQKLHAKLKNATIDYYQGPLAFVEDWEYFVPSDAYYEAETFKGFYSGLNDAYSVGTELRQRYDHLFDGESVHPVFTSGQKRVVDTAKAFAKGFFASNYTDLASIQVIPEKKTQGANTLTSHDACTNYDGYFNDYLVNEFPTDYLETAAARLNALSPGYNLTSDDIYNLMGYCGFELNAVGTSKVCGIFTPDEWSAFSYTKSLGVYYSNGPGYNLSAPIGSVLVNNTYSLFSEYYPYNLTFSFTHDTDLSTYVTALGIFTPDYDLSVEEIEFGSIFRASEITPMGARVITEKLQCFNSSSNSTDDFVRIIVNDAVIPIPGCQSGPGFTCPLDGYKENFENILNGTTYVEACGVNASYPQYTSFYWDWEVTFEDN